MYTDIYRSMWVIPIRNHQQPLIFTSDHPTLPLKKKKHLQIKKLGHPTSSNIIQPSPLSHISHSTWSFTAPGTLRSWAPHGPPMASSSSSAISRCRCRSSCAAWRSCCSSAASCSFCGAKSCSKRVALAKRPGRRTWGAGRWNLLKNRCVYILSNIW